MSAPATAFSGAFDEPVARSQEVFRLVMDAMARPGTIAGVAAAMRAPKPLGLAQGAIALCLCDHDTTIWLTQTLSASTAAPWLSFHSGARVTRNRPDADFAFVEGGSPFPALSAFARGTDAYPDRSTTLVVEIESLTGGPGLTLMGPGIDGSASFAPKGLPEGFVMAWAENRALFPRGVDLVLTAGQSLACLPRSVRISTERTA
jgi:alpha-D-ribose 1-methylphosphonate 5-triphosphate synthase subunit PhnH